jgi:DNA-binding GntR family transcriptional regulator
VWIMIEANAEQAEALGVEIGSPLLKVVRVIHAEGRPVAFLIDILPTDILSPKRWRPISPARCWIVDAARLT